MPHLLGPFISQLSSESYLAITVLKLCEREKATANILFHALNILFAQASIAPKRRISWISITPLIELWVSLLLKYRAVRFGR